MHSIPIVLTVGIRKALIKSKTEEKVIENANLVARKEQNMQINKN
jgi:2-phospho-L-lactate transferase/gluconeogenesis factor (CofD/UPF0052 family)